MGRAVLAVRSATALAVRLVMSVNQVYVPTRVQVVRMLVLALVGLDALQAAGA